MNILLWTGSYAPGIGGVEVVVQALACDLVAAGHAVQVVTQSADDAGRTHPAPEGVVHYLPFHQVLSSRDASRVTALSAETKRIVRDFAPDVVHAHAVHPGAFFLLRSLEPSCPLVFTLHGWTSLAPGENTMRERMLRRANWVTGCSQDTTDAITRHVPDVAARTCTVLNGCQDPGIAAAPLPFEPPCLLGLGRLVESKGFDDLLEAFRITRLRHPAARLTIAGDGPHREGLQHASLRLGIAECITFPGGLARRDVWDAINRSTLVVVPSRVAEGLALVAIEAGVMERPVVASRAGGLAEAVVDGRTGFLVQSGEPTSLARSILQVLEDRELAVRLGRDGRRHVLARFGWDVQVKQYLTVYEQVAGRNRYS